LCFFKKTEIFCQTTILTGVSFSKKLKSKKLYIFIEDFEFFF